MPVCLPPSINFNPRSLCRERRSIPSKFTASCVFQSTLPMQGATVYDDDKLITLAISIHAPYAGSDDFSTSLAVERKIFQSTLPMQGATVSLIFSPISIKFQSTLPMQGATERNSRASAQEYFNPRSLCRERLQEVRGNNRRSGKFQSTLPMQGATVTAS